MCYITLITPLSRGWWEVSGAGVPGCPRQAAQPGGVRQREVPLSPTATQGGVGGGVGVGVCVWGGSLKTKQLCVREARGHANSSRTIAEFLSDIGFTFHATCGLAG